MFGTRSCCVAVDRPTPCDRPQENVSPKCRKVPTRKHPELKTESSGNEVQSFPPHIDSLSSKQADALRGFLDGLSGVLGGIRRILSTGVTSHGFSFALVLGRWFCKSLLAGELRFGGVPVILSLAGPDLVGLGFVGGLGFLAIFCRGLRVFLDSGVRQRSF